MGSWSTRRSNMLCQKRSLGFLYKQLNKIFQYIQKIKSNYLQTSCFDCLKHIYLHSNELVVCRNLMSNTIRDVLRGLLTKFKEVFSKISWPCVLVSYRILLMLRILESSCWKVTNGYTVIHWAKQLKIKHKDTKIPFLVVFFLDYYLGTGPGCDSLYCYGHHYGCTQSYSVKKNSERNLK